ncbi:MAG: hypothetical protein ACXVCP_11310 [Bdellovibrio sp.]
MIIIKSKTEMYFLSLSATISFLLLMGCSADNKLKGGASNPSSSDLPECTDNTPISTACKVSTNGKVITSTLGSAVTSWSNGSSSTTVTGTIPTGFYSSQSVSFQDNDLVASNIVSGANIFGVAGTASSGALPNCSSNGLQSSACTATSSSYWTTVLGTNITPAAGTLSTTVPAGYYTGAQTVTMSDADLIATNILSGVNIFGVAGSAVAAYGACNDNALNAGQCSTSLLRYVTGTLGGNVTSWSNGSGTTVVSGTIPQGFYGGNSIQFTEANLLSSNIKNGVSIFGVTGNYTGGGIALASNANRDPAAIAWPFWEGQTTSLQLSVSAEVTTYKAANLPTTGGYNYRDIPDQDKDDDGYTGLNVVYALRPQVNCGTSGSIDARIADCATQNPTRSTWDGSTASNSGYGMWKLVTRKSANKEVWRDERTKLIWSSLVGTSVNWCQASGNTQNAPVTFYKAYNTAMGTPLTGNGTILNVSGGSSSIGETITVIFTSATTFNVTGGGGGCNDAGGAAITAGGLTGTAGSTVTYGKANFCSFTLKQGATNFAAGDTFQIKSTTAASYSCAPGAAAGLQPASPISYCAENGSLNAPPGDTWGSGPYMDAKGGMGKDVTDSVRWRLPTKNDYTLAENNGIRFVMPDMGAPGTERAINDGSPGPTNWTEWAASVISYYREYSWHFNTDYGNLTYDYRYSTWLDVRCVGR